MPQRVSIIVLLLVLLLVGALLVVLNVFQPLAATNRPVAINDDEPAAHPQPAATHDDDPPPAADNTNPASTPAPDPTPAPAPPAANEAADPAPGLTDLTGLTGKLRVRVITTSGEPIAGASVRVWYSAEFDADSQAGGLPDYETQAVQESSGEQPDAAVATTDEQGIALLPVAAGRYHH
ncbi:MAG: hypothetical protein AB7S36_23170, partial [Planctomycetota bacterium]